MIEFVETGVLCASQQPLFDIEDIIHLRARLPQDEENRLDHILAIFFPSQEATAEHDQIRIILPEKTIKGPAVTFAYCRKQQLVITVTTTSIHQYFVKIVTII